MTNAALVEAILFHRGEAMSHRELSRMSGIPREDIPGTLAELQRELAHRGIALIVSGEEAELRTAPEAGAVINDSEQLERSGDLTRAALETLALVLYRGPLSRGEIDAVRGVDSRAILRTLTLRGLVVRMPSPQDAAASRYAPSTETLALFGIRAAEELPDYERFAAAFSEVEESDA